ncbi:Asp23/Gls24 family envelope stress response protein [Arthrobacter sp. AL08]|uniref:Asp23/Gls24 family envelope stress response protein n=1 Tax=unclassified Arthrobacter TaxID=235627 RepID=UPI002499D14B|nr:MULTISPECIES: Asp23/Gls24 family envelope stress response protein [unclassified Arthrobacter]MDI3243346.1 Asp23/Gls24 family envelope stress response protein [Arthrobacter sp. AL05]MDI3279348.1 Asp23/Gls24 family envelope stress response protein [Arthrobacter sp. AL08]
MNDTTDTGCGRTIEDLSDYLDNGTTDDLDHISTCPQCQAGLAGLRRLREITNDLLAEDLAEAGRDDSPWLESILANLNLEMKAGRSIPLAPELPGDLLFQTEGALCGLVRSVGDTIEGIMIGKCRFTGDVNVTGTPIAVDVNVSARYGYRLPELAATLRTALDAALATHSELNITELNITITELRPPSPSGSKG